MNCVSIPEAVGAAVGATLSAAPADAKAASMDRVRVLRR
jgi:hypothetical protein